MLRFLSLLLFFIIMSLIISASSVIAETPDARSKDISASLARLKGKLEVAEHRAQTVVQEPVAEKKSDSSLNFLDTAGKMLKGLAICIGLFFVGISVMKRMKPQHFVAEPRMRVTEKLSLSQKSGLVIVEIDGQEHLLSVGSEPVTKIDKISGNNSTIPNMQVAKLCSTDVKLSA